MKNLKTEPLMISNLQSRFWDDRPICVRSHRRKEVETKDDPCTCRPAAPSGALQRFNSQNPNALLCTPMHEPIKIPVTGRNPLSHTLARSRAPRNSEILILY